MPAESHLGFTIKHQGLETNPKFPRDSEASMRGSPAAVPELFPPEHRSLAMQCQSTPRPTLELLGRPTWDMGLALGAPMTRCDVLYYTLYIYTIIYTCVSKLPIHVAGPIIVAYVDRNSLEMRRDKVSRGAQMVGLKINHFLALKIPNSWPIYRCKQLKTLRDGGCHKFTPQ